MWISPSAAKPLQLGVLETGGWGATSEGARRAFAAAKQRLPGHGVELKSRADDPDIEAVEQAIADALPLTMAINAWEGRWPLNTYADIDASKLSQAARDRLKTAEAMTQKEYGELLKRRDAVRATYAKAASRTTTRSSRSARAARRRSASASTGNTAMNVSASLLGCPALTMPVLADEGLPLGLQLLGRTERGRRAVRRCDLDCGRCAEPARSGGRGGLIA